MTQRTTLGATSMTARMDKSRATCREFDGDQQLCQTIKKCDVFHSETHSDIELWEPVGHTSVAIKQKEDEQQKKQQEKSSQSGGAGGQNGGEERWNHDQPKGESAEAVTLYLNGSRSHCVAIATDRRVRPYQLKAGRGCTYAPDGSEQMLYFKQDGTYLVSLDGKSVEKPEGKDKRQMFIGHVTKKMQSHKIEEKKDGGGAGAGTTAAAEEEEYKHEGDKINTGIRFTEKRIEFVSGDKVYGYFDKEGEKWNFNGKTKENEFSGDYTLKADNIRNDPQTKHDLEKNPDSFVEGQGADLSSKVAIKKDGTDSADPGIALMMSSFEQRIMDLERRIVQLESTTI